MTEGDTLMQGNSGRGGLACGKEKQGTGMYGRGRQGRVARYGMTGRRSQTLCSRQVEEGRQIEAR